jgi:hypothetical protein
MKYAGRLTVPVILVMSIVTASLWQRLLRRPVSESGRLCSGGREPGGSGAHTQGRTSPSQIVAARTWHRFGRAVR